MKPLEIHSVAALRWRVMSRCPGFLFTLCVLNLDGSHERPCPWFRGAMIR